MPVTNPPATASRAADDHRRHERVDRSACPVAFGGASLLLMANGCVFVPGEETLLVADVHLGKADTFRRLGVPVPAATSGATLAALDAAIAQVSPKQVVVLGDLIHGRLPESHVVYEMLAKWRSSHADLAVHLVVGNHDRAAGALPATCGIARWPAQRPLAGLQLCHEPDEATPGAHAICGHLHPVLRLRGNCDTLRLRCFWLQPMLATLPAFGEFTGGYPIAAAGGDRVFVIDGEAVYPVPPGGRTRSINGRS